MGEEVKRIFFVLSLLALLVGAGGASAAPIQQEVDAASSWLSGTLNSPVPTREVVLTTSMWHPDNIGEIRADNRLYLRPSWAKKIERHVVTSDELGTKTSYAAKVLLHEQLHRRETVFQCPGRREEMITDAMAVDLTPAFVFQVWKKKISWAQPAGRYEDDVIAFLYESADRAKTPNRENSRKARELRRKIWAMSCSQRDAILDRWGL